MDPNKTHYGSKVVGVHATLQNHLGLFAYLHVLMLAVSLLSQNLDASFCIAVLEIRDRSDVPSCFLFVVPPHTIDNMLVYNSSFS